MDLNKAILFGQAVNAAYAIDPHDLNNRAGTSQQIGSVNYDVVSSIYGNDLSTDANPERGNDFVSLGLVLQAAGAGDVVVAVRGTEGYLEWIHDAQFLLKPCPILPTAGATEDGFTAMYLSMHTGTDPNSPTVAQFIKPQSFQRPVTSVTICGHSLGGALATLLALDVAVNGIFFPSAYTYASPRTGDPQFVRTYNHLVPDTTRIANRLDVVPNLPFPPLYEHVLGEFPLNPVNVTLIPFKVEPLLNLNVVCLHILTSYLHLLSLQSGGTVLPLEDNCKA
ncbi:MAG TPA: lipase family protein [Candidatus Solibacter sp.]|nr:lipase family protein [Candidatus Solibacter sp.]